MTRHRQRKCEDTEGKEQQHELLALTTNSVRMPMRLLHVTLVCMVLGICGRTNSADVTEEFRRLRADLRGAGIQEGQRRISMFERQYRPHSISATVRRLPLEYMLALERVRLGMRHNLSNPLADYRQLCQAQTALAHADPLLTESNAWVVLYLARAHCYQDMRRFGDAECALEMAVRLVPSNGTHHARIVVCRADLDLCRGRYQRALAAMRSLWEQHAHYPRRAPLVYARCLFRAREEWQAWTVLLDSLKRNGVSPLACERDELYALGLENLPGAPAGVVRLFYDALGIVLLNAPRVKGNQALLALLINQRAVMRMCDAALPAEDDLVRLASNTVPRIISNASQP
jgi:tetratricopeptide (TPR) repeat protein